MKHRPRLLNVFAGAGGLALGFEQSGFSIDAALESDPVHAATFKRNFGSAEVVCAPVQLDALGKLKASSFDVVAGSLPSSAFSIGGRRDPRDDRRQLLDRFVDVVAAIQPAAYALEAVPGILNKANAASLHAAIGRLADEGYATPQIWNLDAAAFGVPQTRRRVWVVGTKDGIEPPVTPDARVIAVHRRPTGLPVMPRDGLPVGPTVRDAIGDLPNPSDYVELRTSDRMKRDPNWQAPSQWAMDLMADRTIGFSVKRRVNPDVLTASQATAHTMGSVLRFTQTEPGTAEPVSRFYRLHSEGLARTLRAGTGRDRGSFTGARPLHPTQPRVITVREGARLQGFPDWFGFNATKWHGFHQVGASAPPPVARAIADRLIEALRFHPSSFGEELVPDESLLFLDLTRAARHMGATTLPEPRRRGLRGRLVRPHRQVEKETQLTLPIRRIGRRRPLAGISGADPLAR
jgi:DNA (cytosine-5)-methyltransferase 1